jgi:RNA polymerase sigma-B factor
MRTRAQRRETRVRKSLGRLQAAGDAALAAVTIPLDAPERQHLVAAETEPAVDAVLWADHVVYHRREDEAALARLVDHYRSHAESQARRHYRRGEPLEDLTQIALEALLLALKRFDPDRRRPFLAFARPTMTGMIRRHFRDTGWSIRVPRRVHELASPMREARELLTHDFGREPTNAEVADFIGADEADVLEVLNAEEVRMPSSLDAVDPTSQLQTEQVVGRNDAGFLWIENRTALQQTLGMLSEEDRELLRLYFIEEHTQTEIADRVGCSQMQVSRLLARAIRRLRKHIVGV